MTRFQSIFFDQSDPVLVADGDSEPAFFSDLNLDQVRDAMLAGREEYELRSFFTASLRDAESVHYRQEIVRDLERDVVRAPVDRFAREIRAVRQLVARRKKSHYGLERQRLFLEACDRYCDAVRSLAEALGVVEVHAAGIRALIEYLREYVGSDPFTTLTGETRALLDELGTVGYTLQIKGARVRVGKYEGEADFSAELERTFAKFRVGQASEQLAKRREWPELNHVEAQVLERVARLHPEVFASLAAYCDRNRKFFDPVVGRFDREVQFYLAYLDHIEPLKADDLAFCYPQIASGREEIHADDAFDLALASKLVSDSRRVVCNSFALTHPERIIVITGPNQGGKTTFARMFGQLHHLASLGLPVPGRRARLRLPDKLFTHFEREENLANLRGKLEDELIRVREIVDDATGESIVVMNESFASTTLADALVLGTGLIGRLAELDALSVYVTFVDELSALGEATVSMVATVAPDDPAVRTFKVVRRPADGLAYAAAIAGKYGLGYEALKRRVAR